MTASEASDRQRAADGRAAPSILVVEHESTAGVGLIGNRLAAAGAQVVTVGPEAGRPVPHDPTPFDGVIVLGGSMGPTDDEEAAWLPDVRALIDSCLKTDTPLLGVCLGAQLLAHVAGGTVGTSTSGPEIGLTRLMSLPTVATDPVLRSVPSDARAVQWHWLEVQVLPETAIPLMSSEHCVNQAFRVGSSAWGLQFHLEVLTDTTSRWASDDRESLDSLGLDSARIVGEVRRSEARLLGIWAEAADNWIEFVQNHRPDGVTPRPLPHPDSVPRQGTSTP